MYSLLFFSIMLHGGPAGMPAKLLMPALFAAGVVLQSLLLRFAKGKKRFSLFYLSLGAIVLCETAGRLDNGLAEILIVALAWSLLLGALLALAVCGLSIRL